VRRAALAVLVLLLAVAGCRVRTEVDVQVAEDGSGVVTVAVGLDEDALDRVGRLEDELRLDDLVATGWEVTEPALEADGLTWIRASKPFQTPEEAATVLAEVTGTDGPFRDVAVTRERSFARTRFGFEGTVDLSGGLEAFSDEALATALDGVPLGEDVAAIEERIGAPLDEAFSLQVAVRLPGALSSTNAPTRAGESAVWEPRLSDQGPVYLTAESEVVRSRSVVFLAGAVLAAVAALAVALGFPWRRRRRARGRHAAAD
jgi:hypothetical protein